jgi:hypothetical protein
MRIEINCCHINRDGFDSSSFMDENGREWFGDESGLGLIDSQTREYSKPSILGFIEEDVIAIYGTKMMLRYLEYVK